MLPFGYNPIQTQPYLIPYQFEVNLLTGIFTSKSVNSAKENLLDSWRLWFRDNWTISLYIGVFYIVTIFALQKWIKNSPKLQTMLIAKEKRIEIFLLSWNVILCAFSLFAFTRFSPELLYIIFRGETGIKEGFRHAACDITSHGVSMASFALVYTFSKVVQLGDTYFIVIRQKPLVSLHWYHHLSVMVLSWYTYESYIPLLRFVGSMNYFVHVFLYGYFALKSVISLLDGDRSKDKSKPQSTRILTKVRSTLLPFLSVFVTLLELSQMIVGFFTTSFIVYQHYRSNQPCLVNVKAISACAVIYSSLFVLIIRFYFFQSNNTKKSKQYDPNNNKHE